MLQVFYYKDNEICKASGIHCFENILLDKIFWIDMQFATEEEKIKIESIAI